MRVSCFRAISVVSVLTLSTHAFALTYGQAEGLAKKLPKEYMNPTDHGKLCEVLGVQVMQDLHPNATIYNGVVYKKKSMTVGELDLVVVEDNVVTNVVEVKCWKSYNSAAHKADTQLDRFSNYIGRCDVDFSLNGKAIPCDIFGNPNIRLGKMSYSDAAKAGFDYSLDLTRSQILQLINDVRSGK